MEFCKPQCVYWKEKLERCETKLEVIIKTNPTKSCMYPMRDWVTCVEACVSIVFILCCAEGRECAQPDVNLIYLDST